MTEQERYSGTTPFSVIYDAFFNLVTDDMYLEWYEDETRADIKNIFLAALTKFQFPRFKLYDYEKILNEDDGTESIGDKYNFLLTHEEINIFANLMIIEWITRQVATADITKQKYSSSDFKFTSQANHMVKLLDMKKSYQTDSTSIQRLYKRRMTDADGYIKSNYGGLGGKSSAN